MNPQVALTTPYAKAYLSHIYRKLGAYTTKILLVGLFFLSCPFYSPQAYTTWCSIWYGKWILYQVDFDLPLCWSMFCGETKSCGNMLEPKNGSVLQTDYAYRCRSTLLIFSEMLWIPCGEVPVRWDGALVTTGITKEGAREFIRHYEVL